MIRHLLLSIPLLLSCLGGVGLAQETSPPSRDLLLELTAQPRLAGTSGSLRAARFVGGVLERAGWSVEYDEREVLLSMLHGVDFLVFADEKATDPLVERHERFDPDANPPGDVPQYSAWSASGKVRGKVVDAGRGLRADFERLKSLGVDLHGTIALVRYGGSYRGVKVDLASEFGCGGVLLFGDPADDGAGKGAAWPVGPWKPDTAAQRGSISPMGRAPGDPTTPGFGSPKAGHRAPRTSMNEVNEKLPRVPCIPIGAREALLLIDGLREVAAATSDAKPRRIGPGPIEVELTVDAPRELRTIRNVIASMPGVDQELVIAGNHRDAWVRGANDAGSGTVALLRAAQHLGERVRGGWKPAHTVLLGFWDAEEFGLIGSTEWGEANSERLSRDALVYINADTAVGGTKFNASGSPGLLNSLLAVLDRVPGATGETTLGSEWRASFKDRAPSFDLPGSGSDFAVFLHHLAVPVIDFGFGGNSGGQYHTHFDDFAMVDRYLDPGFVGHELAGRFVAELLATYADREDGGFDNAEAARAMAELVRAAGREGAEGKSWLGAERAEPLAAAFDELVKAVEANATAGGPRIYSALAEEKGLAGRPWYRNQLWAPGLETGYSSETFPNLRAASQRGAGFLELEMKRLLARVAAATAAWKAAPR
ncbi:MAG TPA: M28 family peptidase [Planctomycetota bacterium]|nr:M28 family peptidase [Planctomycetota bacterium]